jgi:type IV pilus assembly protein PilC
VAAYLPSPTKGALLLTLSLAGRYAGKMAEFAWEARGKTGELRKGVMEAETENTVNTKLRAQQLNPTKVKKKSAARSFQLGTGVGQKDLVTFTRLFATMIDAGLPIVQCLDILANQTDNKFFQVILRDIKGSVEQGATFSDSLRKHPKVFDPLYCNLVQAGEVGGILDTILNRLAVYIEKAVKLKRQVRGALFYPTTVMVVFVGVLSVLLIFVIPSFQKMFTDFGAKDELPVLTQWVISVSNAVIGHLPIIVLFAIVAGVLLSMGYRRPRGKKFAHSLMLKLPVMGPVLRKIAVARFTRTLGTLLSSGVPILDALDIVAKTAGNVVVEEGILYTRLRISEGKNMAGPLLETNVFPPMVVQMVGVGEQTGALDTMLNKIADFYEEEVDVAVGALTSLIEPVMMVGIGGTVGVVLIAMYLPIFSIAGKIKAE